MVKVKRDSVKRRAVSPAASDASEHKVNEVIRKKRQKRSSFAQAGEGFSSSQRNGEAAFLDLPAHTTSGQDIPTPPAEEVSIGSDGVYHEPPANLISLLGRERSCTNVFKGAVDDMINVAFQAEAGDDATAPGLRLINLVPAELRGHGASESKISEVEHDLRTAWLDRMAKFTGAMISNSDELRSVFGAIAASVSFRSGQHGFVFQPAKGLELVDTEVTKPRNSQVRNPSLDPARRSPSRSPARLAVKRERRVVHHAEGSHDVSVSAQQRNESFEDTEWVATRADVAKAAQTTTANANEHSAVSDVICNEVNPKRLFARAFDVFFHHVQNYRRNTCSESPEEGAEFKERTKLLYNTLDRAQKTEWRKLRNAGSGALDAASGHRLLNQMGIDVSLQLLFWQFGPSTVQTNPASTPELEIAPMFIPFSGKADRQLDPRQKLQLLANTPDTPSMDLSEESLHTALSSAFGSTSLYCGVEKWNAYIWTATFRTSKAARNWKGRTIEVEGKRFETEHVYGFAPRKFIADFSNVKIDESEVVSQVMRTFSDTGIWPELYVQEYKKLYAGKQYIVRCPNRGAKWMRFYIPMRKKPSGTQMMCFKPLSKVAQCALCGYSHNGDLCDHAKKVPLQSSR